MNTYLISVQALYGQTHPDYERYLYLIAPISVAFLNPIGFLLMEIHKWRTSDPGERKGCCQAITMVLLGVISNPIVFMTVLGIIGNFIFHQKVPSYLDNILEVLSKWLLHIIVICSFICWLEQDKTSCVSSHPLSKKIGWVGKEIILFCQNILCILVKLIHTRTIIFTKVLSF